MRLGFSSASRAFAELIALLMLVTPGSASARSYDYTGHEVNQKDAGGYASNNYWNGSGDSKDEGVRNGTRALNRLASLDIGGAIHYGYKGYGNYINSQKMDDLDSRAWKNKGKMDSIHNAPVSGQSGGGTGNGSEGYSAIGPEREAAKLPPGSNGRRVENGESGVTGKKWGDMDRGFLYRGETGEVAAEFERRSGMSRELLFDHIASAVDANLSYDDPSLMEKLEGRYRNFMAQLPDREFKKNIEKAYTMFSWVKKQSMLQEAASFYFKNRGEAGPQEMNADAGNVNGGNGAGGQAAGTGDGRAPASDPAAALGGAAEAAPMIAQLKPAEEKPRLTREQMGMYLGLEGSHGNELQDVIGDPDTIFRSVHKRYRKLTPMMIGRISSVLESR